jgi:hypothetical protein
MDVTQWSDAEIEKHIADVYDGSVSPAKLPVDLYKEIHKRLMSGVIDGFSFGIDDALTFSTGSRELDLLEHFNHNVAIFSGAKTHQQVVDMTREVFKDGTKQSFADFKESAGKIFDTYNKDWLLTEFKMSHNQALSGRRWLDITRNADVFPALKYVTTGDQRVRDEHVILDGIVRPVNDLFWRRFYPPNDWGCRCGVEQMTEREFSLEKTPDAKIEQVKQEYTPSKLFDGNAGIDKIIWQPEHPYFLVSDRYKLLKENNFNLPVPPLPKKVKIVPETPATTVVDPVRRFIPAKNIKDAEKFAREVLEIGQVDFKGLDIDVANAMNESVFQTKSLMPKYKMNGFGSVTGFQKALEKEFLEVYRTNYIYETLVKTRGVEQAEKYILKTVRGLIPKQSNNGIAFSFDFKPMRVGEKTVDVSKYHGIYMSTKFTKPQLDALVKNMSERGWFTKGSTDFKYIMNHELGHEIDGLVSFKNDPDFVAIFNREHNAGIGAVTDRLSEYGATAGKIRSHRNVEMIAECWAEYTTSKTPRPLAKEVSELMLKKYHTQHLQGVTTVEKFIETATQIISK